MSNYNNESTHYSYSDQLNEDDYQDISQFTISQIFQKHIDTFPFDIATNSTTVVDNNIEDKLLSLENLLNNITTKMNKYDECESFIMKYS